METTLIPLDSIRTDAGTQMRAAQSVKTIDTYVENLAKLPAVTVFQIDGTYVLADGFHRLAAYKKSGRDTIPCIVLTGTLDDAREYVPVAQIRNMASPEAMRTNTMQWRNFSRFPVETL